ncbi:HAD family hydrolase, partial [Candidatus Gottesmanbacteria bacterium]|nr:HAD family hydrolase [Candidatus Gottesmanbacteria bacterium]
YVDPSFARYVNKEPKEKYPQIVRTMLFLREHRVQMTTARLNFFIQEEQGQEYLPVIQSSVYPLDLRDAIRLDLAAYTLQRSPKRAILLGLVRGGAPASVLENALQLLRRIPSEYLTPEDIAGFADLPYQTVEDRLQEVFATIHESVGTSLETIMDPDAITPENAKLLQTWSDGFNQAIGLPTVEWEYAGLRWVVPQAFIGHYELSLNREPQQPFLPSLFQFYLDTLAVQSHAFGIEDSIEGKIAQLEDRTGQRHNMGDSLQAIVERESRVSSDFWKYVLSLHQETPNTYTVVLLNERTAPNYGARDHLPAAFARDHRIQQGINDEALWDFLDSKEGDAQLDVLLVQKEAGTLSQDEIRQFLAQFGIDADSRILPLLGYKMPSTDTAARPSLVYAHNLVRFLDVIDASMVFNDYSRRRTPRSFLFFADQLKKSRVPVNIVPLGKVAADPKASWLQQLKDRQFRGYVQPKADTPEGGMRARTGQAGPTVYFFDPWNVGEDKDKAFGDDTVGLNPEMVFDTEKTRYVREKDSFVMPTLGGSVTRIQDFWQGLTALRTAMRVEQELDLDTPQRAGTFGVVRKIIEMLVPKGGFVSFDFVDTLVERTVPVNRLHRIQFERAAEYLDGLEMVKRAGVKVDTDEYRDLRNAVWNRYKQEAIITGREFPIRQALQKIVEELFTQYAIDGTRGEVERVAAGLEETVYQVERDVTRIKPDALRTLRVLKDRGYRIGIFSNTQYSYEFQRSLAESLGLMPYVDYFETSSRLGWRKSRNTSEAYRRYFAAAGVEDIAGAIHIGDSRDDYLGARAAGAYGIQVDFASAYPPIGGASGQTDISQLLLRSYDALRESRRNIIEALRKARLAARDILDPLDTCQGIRLIPPVYAQGASGSTCALHPLLDASTYPLALLVMSQA